MNRFKTAEKSVFLHLGASVGMHVPNSVVCFKYFSVICETITFEFKQINIARVP